MKRIFSVACLCLLGNACVTVRPGEGGVLFQPLQKTQSTELLKEGAHPVAPWDRVAVYNLRWQTSAEKVHIHTSDKLHMEVQISLTYRPLPDHILEINRTLGRGYYATSVRPLLLTAMRAEFARHTYDVLFSQASQIQESIKTELKTGLEPLGIEVDHVTLDDIDFPQETESAIARQNAMLQEVKNKELELKIAQRDADVVAAAAKGKAEAELATKEAQATIAARDGEIALVRARSDAEANKLRESSITASYLRLRAIEAQEKLAQSPNAKLYFVPTGKDGVPVMLRADVEK